MVLDIFLSSSDSSAAFKAGQAAGMVIGVILMLLIPATFVLCLVQLVRTKKRGWLIGLICSTIPVLIFVGLVAFSVYQHQVLTWTLRSKESNAMPVFEDVVESIKKIAETGL